MRIWSAPSAVLLGLALLSTNVHAQQAGGTAAIRRPAVAASQPVPKPNLPAGTSIFVTTMNAWDLQPEISTVEYGFTFINGGSLLRNATTGSGGVLAGGLHLPTGVLIDHIELDYCDTDAANDILVNFFQCDDSGAGPGGCNVIDSISPSGTPGCTFAVGATPLNYTPQDQANNDYAFEVTLPNSATVGFRGVKVYYLLQVSPAPVTATFNDVPTSDFAFQFIEAFNAAGITVGCQVSPPLFCPDRNVTRREMAVFFAKALGLNWPF